MTSSLIGLPSLPASVHAGAGRGGLPRLVVTGPASSAEIYLQGAHVTEWTPVGADSVIWTSGSSVFAPATPIRGGVPICFPWFGPHPAGAGLHGFARTADWSLVRAVEQDDEVILELRLTDSDVPGATAWPHPFEARLTVSVGASLGIQLDVVNTGPDSVTFEEAFHTYLAVGDVREVAITGLEGSPYVDRLLGDGQLPASGDSVRITAETDRVYAQPGTIKVLDPEGGRSLAVTAQGSGNAVLWNPWIAKAAAMADFGDDEWTDMLCVETCNVFDHAVSLAPGETATMAATITVQPLS